MIMGLQFTPGSQMQPAVQPQTAPATTLAKTPEEAALDVKIEEAKNFNIQVTADQIKQELATSEEIDKLVSTINLNDSNTIVKFGAGVSVISRIFHNFFSFFNQHIKLFFRQDRKSVV